MSMRRMVRKAGVILVAATVLCATGGTLFAGGSGERRPAQEEITFTSWRTEDIQRMQRINRVFMEENPDIRVIFSPVSDQEYDAQMQAAIGAGVGAEIVFVRSYDPGRVLYDSDLLEPLNQLLPQLESFPPAAIDAWGTEEGTIYAIPFVGVTHGVYYNKGIFRKHNLSVPRTWDEFIQVSRTLKEQGETVFAQGTQEGWPLYEVIYSGLGANFYGGEAARQKLLKGEMRLTDRPFVRAFEKALELEEFFPRDHSAIDYVSMQQMFGTGNAAMFIGGSWEIGIFEDLGLGDDLGWFPPPVERVGDRLQYCFHVDAGIGLSRGNSGNAAALSYLEWASTPEFAQLFMNELPGFFAYTPGNYDLNHPVASKMIDAAQDADLTVRTVWQHLSAQVPSGNELMEEALILMYNKAISPQEAAAKVQNGLNSWYPAFRN
ncbi:ABC transporter substrate-binding protein [Alkalispirochaeta alkalica]|uniref:ABC transporter substrate-binding protein n=1 Tax=Alkalispirochaeta alkalica TaxID=46356 RepID=UPI0003816A86|nr:ABC transporter substrate-binding protein [Alkalispirochaeta alkalica]